MTERTPAVAVEGLRRSYGTKTNGFEAVRGIDLVVQTGTISALLGVNGAGKSSALEVIEGLAPPSGGSVRVLGLDPIADRARVRRRTGVLLQTSGFPADLTVLETLQMWATTVSNPRPTAETLDLLDLSDRASVRVRSLSGGELRRLDLSCALMARPELILLDEPTTGLDPESRRRVWQLLEELREGGATILLTTHYLEEAERLADHISIMAAGEIVRAGSLAEIAAGSPSQIRFERLPKDHPLPDFEGVTVADDHAWTVLYTPELQKTLLELLTWADGEQLTLPSLSARTASLESVFLSIAERSAAAAPNHNMELAQ